MANQAMGGHLPNLDDIVKDLDLPISFRTRSHCLVRSTRLPDLTIQAQAQLQCLQRWLHSQKEPPRLLELPGRNAGSCHEMATPSPCAAPQTHGTLVRNLRTLFTECGLLSQRHGLSPRKRIPRTSRFLFTRAYSPLQMSFLDC